MGRQWQRVATIRLKGEHCRGGALDLDTLGELGLLQKAVTVTATGRWFSKNPKRDKLPPNFKEQTLLFVRASERDGCTLPLEIPLADEESPDAPTEDRPDVPEALDMTYAVFEAIENDEDLPWEPPFAAFTDYSKLGIGAPRQQAMEFATPGKQMVPLTAQGRTTSTGSLERRSSKSRKREKPTTHRDERNIMEKIIELSASVPKEEWAKLPTDLSARHDYYLYGIDRE